MWGQRFAYGVGCRDIWLASNSVKIHCVSGQGGNDNDDFERAYRVEFHFLAVSRKVWQSNDDIPRKIVVTNKSNGVRMNRVRLNSSPYKCG